MGHVPVLLSIIAWLFVVGLIGEALFRRIHIPDAIWLIVMGAILGPVFGVISREQLEPLIPAFAAIALTVILFEGGLVLNIDKHPVYPRMLFVRREAIAAASKPLSENAQGPTPGA